MILEVSGGLDRPTVLHNLIKEPFSDSILAYIFNEEGEGLFCRYRDGWIAACGVVGTEGHHEELDEKKFRGGRMGYLSRTRQPDNIRHVI